MRIPRLYFWRVSPGNPKARKAVKSALYHAFCRSRIGQMVIKAMKRSSAKDVALRTVRENQSYQVQKDSNSILFIRMTQASLLEGTGTDEQISVLHSWLGHMLYIALQRMRGLARGSVAYLELRHNTLRLICRGRRALQRAWLRFASTTKVGFSGPDIRLFKAGVDEACLISNHASRREVRAAFAYAEQAGKAKGHAVKAISSIN
jgi:hypothetical protein